MFNRSTLLDRDNLSRNSYPLPATRQGDVVVSSSYLWSVWLSGAFVGGAVACVSALFAVAF